MPLTILAAWLLRDRQAAEDVVQDRHAARADLFHSYKAAMHARWGFANVRHAAFEHLRSLKERITVSIDSAPNTAPGRCRAAIHAQSSIERWT